MHYQGRLGDACNSGYVPASGVYDGPAPADWLDQAQLRCDARRDAGMPADAIPSHVECQRKDGEPVPPNDLRAARAGRWPRWLVRPSRTMPAEATS